MDTHIWVDISNRTNRLARAYLQSPEEELLVRPWGTVSLRGRTDDIHPLVVSQMTQHRPTSCKSLVP